MKFEQLSDLVPYAIGGKEKSLSLTPYPYIKLLMPGRHAKETMPKGGDFCVCVTDREVGWRAHQFNHADIFKDLALRSELHPLAAVDLMSGYLDVVTGGDPDKYLLNVQVPPRGVLNERTFLRAVQCLAVAEHRRYAQHEKKFGGRYLPFRFAAGIVEGLWTVSEAQGKERKGRPGVEQLEKENGVPILTQELFNAN
jgi:hypothetical protein